jgi:hypothetical protein
MDVRGELPTFPTVKPAPVGFTDFRDHRERPVDAGLPLVTKQRVVLLPHGRTEPTDTTPNKRSAGVP